MVDHHKKDHSEISLDEWFRTHTSDDERKELFIYMDKALKYIHKNKYCVGIFHPSRIFVLNDDVRYIQFLDLVEMPEDDYEQRDIVKQDLFNSTYIQIGLYFGRFLNRTFLIENADQVLANVPEYAVAYYKGILNGASVYFSDYCFEKDKRALMQFKKEFEDGNSDDTLTERYNEIENVDDSNEGINKYIYGQINGYRDGAFVHMLIIPTIAISMLTLFGVICWLISIFS